MVDNQHVLWDASGKPYNMDPTTGQKSFIPPLAAAQYNDPRMQAWAQSMGVKATYDKPGGQITKMLETGRPSGGFFHEDGTWNPSNGNWDQGLNWGNIISLVIAGAITAGAASAMTGASVPEIQAAASGAGASSGPMSGASGLLGAVGDAGGLAAADVGTGGALGATSGLATLPGLSSTAGAAGSGLGLASSLPAGGAGISTAGMGGGSAITGLLGKAVKPGADNYSDIASLLGSFGQGKMNQRGMQGNLTQGYDRTALADQAGRDATESDAMKKMAQTSYILNGHGAYKPGSIQLNGQNRQLPDFGNGFSAPSDAQKQGATTLQDQLKKRLAPGGTVSPSPLEDYATPGLAENIGQYGAAATAGLGLISKLMGK